MKRIPARTAIASAVRDLDIDNPNSKINAMLEWTREAISFIGNKDSYLRRECELEIENYRAELPSDCVEIIDVKIGSMFPEYTGRSFRLFNKDSNNLADRTSGQSLTHDYTENWQSDKTKFTVENGWINLTASSGTIGLAYRAFPFDEEGEPTIHISQLEAVTAYLIYMFLKARAYTGKTPMNVYKDAEQRWFWLANNARGKGSMPTRAEMDRAGAIWNNLKPWKRIQSQ
jgi:hypothetical protein